jgi:ribosomal subunit interface protein
VSGASHVEEVRGRDPPRYRQAAERVTVVTGIRRWRGWEVGRSSIEGLPGPRRTIPNSEESDVDIVVTGRHTQITDRFRLHLEEKLSKVPQLLPRVSRIDVVVTHEKAVRDCDVVEITCHAKGPVIRAEACTDDLYAALDIALDRLFERLRRVSDRRRVSRGGRRVPESVARATGRVSEGTVAGGLGGTAGGAVAELGEDTAGELAGGAPAGASSDADRRAAGFDEAAAPGSDAAAQGPGSNGVTPRVDGAFGAVGDSPIEVREKVHASAPMTLEDALNQMELVGHDFFLFHDSDTGQPSVVYRRRGWSYGVIHLKVDASEEPKRQASDVTSGDGHVDAPVGTGRG